MSHYAEIDVSLECSSVCVVDANGKIVGETKVAILAHDRRRILHVNVTRHPTSEWTRQQLREAFSGRRRRAIPAPRP